MGDIKNWCQAIKKNITSVFSQYVQSVETFWGIPIYCTGLC